MDLEVVMKSNDCIYIVQFFGAIFKEVRVNNLFLNIYKTILILNNSTQKSFQNFIVYCKCEKWNKGKIKNYFFKQVKLWTSNWCAIWNTHEFKKVLFAWLIYTVKPDKTEWESHGMKKKSFLNMFLP